MIYASSAECDRTVQEQSDVTIDCVFVNPHEGDRAVVEPTADKAVAFVKQQHENRVRRAKD